MTTASDPFASIPSLETGGVQVWHAKVEAASADLPCYERVLSQDERARAERFHFQKDRDQFVVAHGQLRVILARHLAVDPRELEFIHNAHGKPSLKTGCNRDDLRFNLSHSAGLIVFAITRGREVGVDIERLRADIDVMEIAGNYFTSREQSALRESPESRRRELFFRYWTHKEAYVKAKGEGLPEALQRIEISLGPPVRIGMANRQGALEPDPRWTIWPLTLHPEYVGVLVVEGRDVRLQCFPFDRSILAASARDA